MKKQLKLTIFIVLALCLSFVTMGTNFIAKNNVMAQTVTDLDGTDLNGTTILNDDNKYIPSDSYILTDNTGYVVGGDTRYAFSKNGQNVPFLNFFVDTVNGGHVLKGHDYNGYAGYGYIVGEGEPEYAVDSDGNRLKDDDDNDIIQSYKFVDIKLRYNFNSNNNILGSDGKLWSISDDTWKASINGLPSVGVVGKGALIVQKFVPTADKSFPTSSSDFSMLNRFNQKETFGIHTVNFFDVFDPAENQTPFSVYQPKGEDLKKGVFIKLTVAYEIKNTEDVYKEVTSWGRKKTVSSEVTTYKNVVEETTFYLCNTSAEVVFENFYFTSGGSTEGETGDKVQTRIKQVEGAISNNQGTLDGFKLDLRESNFDVKYRFNDSTNYLACSDGQVFNKTGKYEFLITTNIGLKRTKTVYIHEKSNQANVGVYFGDGLVRGSRVFAPTDIYPVYALDGLTLATQNENASTTKHAPLVGRVYLLDGDWDSVERDDDKMPKTGLVSEKVAGDHDWNFKPLKAGNYEAVFANNEEYFNRTATGDTYVFVWRFSVVEEGEAPVINQQAFDSVAGVSDYDPIHYEVVLPTAGSGRVRVVFGEESDALAFASKYYASTVKVTENGYIFDNVTYLKELDMISALHSKAKSIVEKKYFDLTDINTFVTLKENIIVPTISEDSTEQEIADYNDFVNILDRAFEKDVLVFSDDSIKLTIGTPFLNDRLYAYIDSNGEIKTGKKSVYFISIAEYESQKVALIHKASGKEFEVPYGVAVETFLELKNAPTGMYTVVDVNKFGKTEFDAVYIKKGDITSQITFERLFNNTTTTHVLNKLDADTRLRANNVVIKDVVNNLDNFGLIKITKIGEYTKVYEYSEVNNIPAIDEEGNYEITLVDRLGNSVTYYVDIFTSSKVYTFKLLNNGAEVLSDTAYGGKTFALPVLTPTDNKFEFGGWQDEDGTIYTTEYVFNKPQNVTLKAVWNYATVEIKVYDGGLLASYSQKVNALQALPKPTKAGYVLFGYRYIQADNTIRFYRGQINSVPNVPSMRLDAVWTKVDNSQLVEGSGLTIHLVDGTLLQTISGSKTEKIELPKLQDTAELKFAGWLYENDLTGFIFNDDMTYDEIASIGVKNEGLVKLTAIWISVDNDTDVLFAGTTMAGIIGGIGKFMLKNLPVFSLLPLGLFILVLLLKRKKAANYEMTEPVVEGTNVSVSHDTSKVIQLNDIEKAKQKYKNPHANKMTANRIYKKIVTPCIILFMCFIMLVMSGQNLLVAIKANVVENQVKNELQIKTNEALKQQQEKQLKQDQIISTFDMVKETYSESSVTSEDSGDTELSDDKAFLYTLVYRDLLSFGYDVFPASVKLGNSEYQGFGYTDYDGIYLDSDDNIVYKAGFVCFSEDFVLSQSDYESDLEIISYSAEKNEVRYILGFSEQTKPIGYVAFDKYVTYWMQDNTLHYNVQDNVGIYNESAVDVYNYDTQSYCHYSNYDTSYDIDAYTLNGDIDYNQIVEIMNDIIAEQNNAGLQIDTDKLSFVSYQALNDYALNAQDESVLGVDADLLMYYEANIISTSYYLIMQDGTVEVLQLPPDPVKKATVWERIWTTVKVIGAACVGVVAMGLPGVGPYLGGAIISGALDVFMQVTIGQVSPSNIDWISVGTSALIGAVTAGIGQVTGALTKSLVGGIKNAVVKFFVEGGLQVLSGMITGATGYLIKAGVSGEEISLKDCMKAMTIGGLTSAIMFCGGKALKAIGNKIKQVKANKNNVSSTTDDAFTQALEKAKNGDTEELNKILNDRASKIADNVRAEHPDWSKMRQGVEIHKRMQYTNTTIKEFKINDISRADGIDKASRIIFELKPETANSMKAGLKQLARYEQGALQNEKLQDITKWIKILVTYKTK